MCHSDVGSKLIFQIAVAHNEISHSGVGTVVVLNKQLLSLLLYTKEKKCSINVRMKCIPFWMAINFYPRMVVADTLYTL